MGSLQGIMGALLEGGMGSLGADGLLGTFIGSAQSTIQGGLGSLGDLVDIGFGSIQSFSAAPPK
ncbi:hypothetical protein ABI214_06710 [Prescottella soli]|uniref:Uncharacterized protein n=1 Tax=Prescottella soli TaxID=1543852 RepID=A0ABW9FPE4_9NOCA